MCVMLQGNDADIICLALLPDETYTFQTFGGEVDTTTVADVLNWTSFAIISDVSLTSGSLKII